MSAGFVLEVAESEIDRMMLRLGGCGWGFDDFGLIAGEDAESDTDEEYVKPTATARVERITNDRSD